MVLPNHKHRESSVQSQIALLQTHKSNSQHLISGKIEGAYFDKDSTALSSQIFSPLRASPYIPSNLTYYPLNLPPDPASQGEMNLLRKEVASLRNRVVELEQQHEEMERDQRTARHMAALFEEYVLGWSREGNAMVKSHEVMKKQVESGEKMIVALAEKLIKVIGKSSTKLKEFEETQKGHQNKIMDLDKGARESLYKITQIRHMVEKAEKNTPRSTGRNARMTVQGSKGGGATHFATDENQFGEKEEKRLASVEQALETTREALMSNVREVKLNVDSVWGEVKRDHNEHKKGEAARSDSNSNIPPTSTTNYHLLVASLFASSLLLAAEFVELDATVKDLKECMIKNKLMSRFEQKQDEKKNSYSPNQQKLRKTVQRISIINSFAKARLKAQAKQKSEAEAGKGAGSGAEELGGDHEPLTPTAGAESAGWLLETDGKIREEEGNEGGTGDDGTKEGHRFSLLGGHNGSNFDFG